MFRKTSAQLSLLDLDTLFPNMLPTDDWCYIYRDHVCPKIDEEKFRHLFSDIDGAPNKPVKLCISLLIFMGMDKLVWREVTHQFQRRIDWFIATRIVPGDVTLHFTTLFKFYRRLEQDDTARILFQDLTALFSDLCGTSLKKQRTDSFFIHGWLQILSRYGLIKETIRVFLQNLRKQKPGLYDSIKGELSRDYTGNGHNLSFY